MLGINGGEWIVIALIALLVVGPDKLPDAARTVGTWVRKGRTALAGAKAAVQSELDAAQLGDLDPRRFRELALGELESGGPTASSRGPHQAPSQAPHQTPPQVQYPEPSPAVDRSAEHPAPTPHRPFATTQGPAPFDDEAT